MQSLLGQQGDAISRPRVRSCALKSSAFAVLAMLALHKIYVMAKWYAAVKAIKFLLGLHASCKDQITLLQGPMTVEELEAQMLSKQRNQIQQSLQHLQSAAPGYLPAPPSVPFPMPPPPHMLAVPPGSFQPGALPPPMLGHAAGSNVTCEPTVPSGIGPAGTNHKY